MMYGISADGETRQPLTPQEVLMRRQNPQLREKLLTQQLARAQQAKEIKEFLHPFFQNEKNKVMEELKGNDKDPAEVRLRYQLLLELEADLDNAITSGKLAQNRLDRDVKAMEARKENGGR